MSKEYNALVEKLAAEIVNGAVEEVEKEAGFGSAMNKVKGAFGTAGNKVKGVAEATATKAKDTAKKVKGTAEATANKVKDTANKVKDTANKAKDTAKKVPMSAYTGVGGGLAGLGVGVGGTLGYKKLTEKKAADLAFERAVQILVESQLQKTAAEEAYDEAQLGEDASVAVLAELGVDPSEILAEIFSEDSEDVEESDDAEEVEEVEAE